MGPNAYRFFPLYGPWAQVRRASSEATQDIHREQSVSSRLYLTPRYEDARSGEGGYEKTTIAIAILIPACASHAWHQIMPGAHVIKHSTLRETNKLRSQLFRGARWLLALEAAAACTLPRITTTLRRRRHFSSPAAEHLRRSRALPVLPSKCMTHQDWGTVKQIAAFFTGWYYDPYSNVRSRRGRVCGVLELTTYLPSQPKWMRIIRASPSARCWCMTHHSWPRFNTRFFVA